MCARTPAATARANCSELGQLAEQLTGREIVPDGELVHLAADGKPDFAALRRRLVAGGASASAPAAVTFVVFDVLHLDGIPVRRLPYQRLSRSRWPVPRRSRAP